MAPTKDDIREKVTYINARAGAGNEYEIQNWGDGKWALVDADTFNRKGPICNSKQEFHTFLRGFDIGMTEEQHR